jgi:NAD(P)H-flavin reductase
MTEDPGWDGETRRIGADFLRDHLRDGLESFTYFIAGPPAMVDVMAELLLGGGVPEDRVVPSRISGD